MLDIRKVMAGQTAFRDFLGNFLALVGLIVFCWAALIWLTFLFEI